MYNNKSVHGVSFFERLSNDAESPMAGAEPAIHLIASIKRNISILLNARIGESQSCPEFGLFDLNDVASGSFDLGVKIKTSIKASIERFEPRLTQLDIRISLDETRPFSLRFNINGNIRVKSQKQKLEIDLVLDSNRNYRVS